jgi:hypothetical protein
MSTVFCSTYKCRRTSTGARSPLTRRALCDICFSAVCANQYGGKPSRLKIILKCGNCDWVGNEDDIDQVCLDGDAAAGKGRPLWRCSDLQERLDPGSEVPYGECPECSCFCYTVKPRV